jgi:hypothetical protein
MPMSVINAVLTERSLRAACALIAGCAIAIFAFLTLATPLWSDEFLTKILLQASSLPKLWSGIASGIDGNPPLYLTAAWLIIQPLPKLVSSVAVLKLINLGLTVVATFTLYRIGRRIASPSACWIGAVLFITLNDNVLYVASELRTYALFLFAAALAVLFQQRMIELRRPRDTSLAALAYVGLALAHTFGIAYVFCIALAGLLSHPRERHQVRLAAVAVAPAVITMAAWSPLLLDQLQVARPYAWMARPGLAELLETLFASKMSMWLMLVELACIATAAVSAMRKESIDVGPAGIDTRGQPFRYVMLVLVGITAFTLIGWIAAIALFPLFVPRYFTPQLIVAFAVNVAFGEWMLRRARDQRTVAFVASAFLGALIFVNVMDHVQGSFDERPICGDRNGNFFEMNFVRGDLPVIAESPHVFLPRLAYAAHGSVYRFPLDWEVVLKYPQRARGNAVDFHIMQNLQTWAPMPSVMSTADIVHDFQEFLVIEQPGRAWFHNLLASGDVVAEKLATSDGDLPACSLWKVTKVRAAS